MGEGGYPHSTYLICQGFAIQNCLNFLGGCKVRIILMILSTKRSDAVSEKKYVHVLGINPPIKGKGGWILTCQICRLNVKI